MDPPTKYTFKKQRTFRKKQHIEIETTQFFNHEKHIETETTPLFTIMKHIENDPF